MKKVVVASDSFKGSLTSSEVADAVSSAVHDIYPDCKIIKVNMADGGEGLLSSLKGCLKGELEEITVHDPVGRLIQAGYLTYEHGGLRTAVIEMAKASGLTLLDGSERNPLLTSTYGTGEMILDAFRKGCRRFIIGIGGSATNDGGTGMLEALGFRFLDRNLEEISGCNGSTLGRINRIDTSHIKIRLEECAFIVACDVEAVFSGLLGATHVFAPQKGADPMMIDDLEAGMKSFEDVIAETTGKRLSEIKGSGAAGGTGGALYAFLGAELKSGAELITELIGFEELIMDADLVITGEGRIDVQTLMGKGPAIIARKAGNCGIPVIAICGYSELETGDPFKAILPISRKPETAKELADAMEPSNAIKKIRKTLTDYFKQNFDKKTT